MKKIYHNRMLTCVKDRLKTSVLDHAQAPALASQLTPTLLDLPGLQLRGRSLRGIVILSVTLVELAAHVPRRMQDPDEFNAIFEGEVVGHVGSHDEASQLVG